jgi:hypothetical protein
MPMAHNAKKTSVDHDIIHGEYANILKVNVMMCFVCFSHSVYMRHTTSNSM